MLQPVASWGDRKPHGGIRALKRPPCQGGGVSHDHHSSFQRKLESHYPSDAGALSITATRREIPACAGMTDAHATRIGEIGARWDLRSPQCVRSAWGPDPCYGSKIHRVTRADTAHNMMRASREPANARDPPAFLFR